MKRAILLNILSFYCLTTVNAQDWVSFTKTSPEEPIVNVARSDYQQVDFTLEVCGMFKEDITEKAGRFQRVNVLGGGKLDKTGEPELPYIRQLIAIPECEDVQLSTNISGETHFNNYNIYPAPEYIEVQGPEGLTYLEEQFAMDRDVYATNLFSPGISAEIKTLGYLRGQKYAEVYFYPVQFNPIRKELHIYTNYEISLVFNNPSGNINVRTGAPVLRTF